MRKTLLVGRTERGGDVEIEVTLENGRLSICGNVWLRSRRDIEAGGQMREGLAAYVHTWEMPRERFARICEVWERWHLNHMRSGCAHQRAEGWDKRPIDPSKPLNAYGKHFPEQRVASWNMLAWVSEKEHPDGLLSRACPTCGYKYGTAWLQEEIPTEIVAEVEAW